MLATQVEEQIDRREREMGENLDFCRDIFRASPAAFAKFTQFMPLSHHREAAPADAYYIARIVAVRQEDCGPCVQTAVNQARAAGVDRALIAAALAGDEVALGQRLARVRRFAIAVARLDPEAEALRLALVEDLGQVAMVEIAVSIAAVRIFPALKRGLGHAQSCALVSLRM